MHYRLAITESDVASACSLVHDRYVDAGLTQPSTDGFYASSGHRGDSDVLIAFDGDQVAATASIFYEHLPAAATWGDVLSESGEVITAEVGQMAAARGGRFETVLRLQCMCINRAGLRGMERLVIQCHPDHGKYYANMFGCRRISEDVRGCPSVGGAIAELWEFGTARCRAAEQRCCRMLKSLATWHTGDLDGQMDRAARDFLVRISGR